jgi:hypothetical protein
LGAFIEKPPYRSRLIYLSRKSETAVLHRIY